MLVIKQKLDFGRSFWLCITLYQLILAFERMLAVHGVLPRQ